MTIANVLESRKRHIKSESFSNERISFVEREAEFIGLLHETHQTLLNSNRDHRWRGHGGSDALFGGANQQRLGCPAEQWQSLIETSRAHPLLKTLHEDPFTGRAFAKPRGYAGDAQLIDLIYGPEDRSPEPDATPLGLDIYRYTSSAPAADGVRARRGFTLQT